MSLGRAMAGGAVESGRQAHDFYPTPPEVTRALLACPLADLAVPQTIWEPACGDGAMVAVLRAAGHRVHASDLVDRGSPLQDGVGDFLRIRGPAVVDAIVTNPPFALAEAFVRRAHALAVPRLSLLLKAQFWAAASRLPLWRAWPPVAILPLTWRPDFMGLGAPTMDCMWVIWRRGVTGPCQFLPLERPRAAGQGDLL